MRWPFPEKLGTLRCCTAGPGVPFRCQGAQPHRDFFGPRGCVSGSRAVGGQPAMGPFNGLRIE